MKYLTLGVLFSAAGPVAAFVVGLLSFKTHDRALRMLTVYLGIVNLSNVLALGLAINNISNLWTIHLLTPIQFTFLMLVLAEWESDPVTKRTFHTAVGVFILLWLLAWLFVESSDRFNSLTRTLEAMLLVVFSVSVIYRHIRAPSGSVVRSPAFWTAAGTATYFAGMGLLYASSNLLMSISPETLRQAWSIQPVANVLSNIMYCGAFLCPRLR